MQEEQDARITLRLPKAMHRALEAQAKADMRSLNAEIVYLLQDALRRAEQPGG